MSVPATGLLDGRVLLSQLFDPDSHVGREGWQPFHEGVEVLPLYGDRETGPSAALLRYQPGARVPTHTHTDYEHIVVLTGSQQDENGHYGAGSCLIHAAGTRHTVRSEEGCVVLAIWARPVSFDAAR